MPPLSSITPLCASRPSPRPGTSRAPPRPPRPCAWTCARVIATAPATATTRIFLTSFLRQSEAVFDSKLHDARIARQRRDPPERAGREVRIRQAPVEGVEQVEHLQPQLDVSGCR